MKKLIAKYIKNPSPANAEKVASYWVKHPFSGMMLTALESSVLIECLANKGESK